MRVGVIGLGKLGYPVALAMATRHDVVGYDVSSHAAEILRTRRYPHREEGVDALLRETSLRVVGTVAEVVRHADIVFVAVQTPHRPEFEGITRLPSARADFDYTALKKAVAEVAKAAEAQAKNVVCAVISTVLPGTMAREVKPLLSQWSKLVYNPYFIAMGSTVNDFLRPEFVLLGVDDPDAADVVREFYNTITKAKVEEMPVADAEAAKVFYNVFIGFKIAIANAMMEMGHKVGFNCDNVTRALALATERVVSSKYLKGGGGDSGACHPRDCIALSWLAREHNLGFDLFEALMQNREAQTEWLAELCYDHASERGLDIVVLGKAYKSGTNLTVGSYATLLKNLVDEMDIEAEQWDPHVDAPRDFAEPAAFVVATDHLEFYQMRFPKGSVVIDPWGKMQDQPDVEVIRVGRK